MLPFLPLYAPFAWLGVCLAVLKVSEERKQIREHESTLLIWGQKYVWIANWGEIVFLFGERNGKHYDRCLVFSR